MSTRLAILVCVVLPACASLSEIRRTAVEDAGVLEREQDILYRCGLRFAEASSLAIVRSDAVSRVFVSEWAAEGAERWRLTLLVRVHPRYGPGADAVITRDAWRGGAPPALHEEGRGGAELPSEEENRGLRPVSARSAGSSSRRPTAPNLRLLRLGRAGRVPRGRELLWWQLCGSGGVHRRLRGG